MRTRREPRSERGTAAVEFALVLPLVLVVALALVQTGCSFAIGCWWRRRRALERARPPPSEEDASPIRDRPLWLPALDSTKARCDLSRDP